MPREDRRNRIADLAFRFSEHRVEDESIREGLRPRRFSHGHPPLQPIVPLNIAVAFCPDCVGRAVGNEKAIALFGTLVGAAPDVIDLWTLIERLEVTDCLFD